jgi:hypothetical protein
LQGAQFFERTSAVDLLPRQLDARRHAIRESSTRKPPAPFTMAKSRFGAEYRLREFLPESRHSRPTAAA